VRRKNWGFERSHGWNVLGFYDGDARTILIVHRMTTQDLRSEAFPSNFIRYFVYRLWRG
jgi:hypothetical protein